MKNLLKTVIMILEVSSIISCMGNNATSERVSENTVMSMPTIAGGILIANPVLVIDTANVIYPSGSLTLTNAGNATLTLGSTTVTTGITNLSGCTNGSTLTSGESCIITFNVSQSGGNANITVNYIGITSSSITQTVNWYNSLNGALVNISYTNPVIISNSTSTAIPITITNSGGYNLSNITPTAAYGINGAAATVAITYPTSNSCQGATLNVGQSCGFILNVSDTAVETNKQIIFGVSGNYNSGSAQTYTRYAILTYSVAPATYLYVTNSHGTTVSAYVQNPTTGALTQMSNSPVAAGDEPTSAVLTLDNKYLYVSNYQSSNIYAYSINQTNGLLSHIGTYTTSQLPLAAVLTPNGKFLYVGTWVGHAVNGYVINSSTGALSSAGTYNIGAQTEVIVIDSTSNFLYVTGVNNKIFAYRINQSNGQLSGNGSLATGDLPISMVITPNNKFIYVANYYDNNISIYEVNQSNGTITSIGTSSAGANPGFLAVSPNSNFLYTLGNGYSINGYTINQSTGALTPIGTFYVGGSMTSIVISLDGKYLYTGVYTGDPFVAAFSINQTTGALTLIGNYPSGYSPSPYLDTVNGFLYTANGGGYDISGFSMNSANGSLAEIANSPFVAGASPASIQIAHIY